MPNNIHYRWTDLRNTGLRVFILAFSASTLLSSFLASPAARADERALVFVGIDHFAPYSYTSNNILSGFAVELADTLSSTIEREISIRLLQPKECISHMDLGAADGIFGFPASTRHSDILVYSKPLARMEFAIFVQSDNTLTVSQKALEGTIVAVSDSCVIIDHLEQTPKIQLLKTATTLQALEKLKNREVTAVIAEKNVGLFYIQQNKIQGIKIAGPRVGPLYEYCIAVRKPRAELLKDINRGIDLLERNGTLEELKIKWLGLTIVEPFPWKLVIFLTAAITGVMLFLAGILWVICLNATVRVKTEHIQLLSQKMAETDKLAVLGKLAGQIAHELRTPLSIINNSVYLMRREQARDPGTFKKRLDMLEDKVKLTSNILESILSYSRIKAAMATTISVKTCIEEVLSDMEVPEDFKMDVRFDKEDSLVVFMDFHQLYSVLRNLVLNALQSMDRDGSFTIHAFPSDNDSRINIRVCDTGGGIPAESKDRIFDLFYTSKITGTGLGLPISKSIVETNSGEIILESTSGKGSCFLVRLPSSKVFLK